MCWITNQTGYTWNLTEIAEVCGVSRQAIRQMFNQARRRLWRNLHREHDLIADLNEAHGMDRSNRLFLP